MHTLHLGLCSSLKRVWNTLMLDESPETVRCCEEGAGLDDPAGQAGDDKDVRQQRHCCRSPEKMPWMRISSGAGYLQSACKSKADHLLKSRIRVRNLVNTSSRSYEHHHECSGFRCRCSGRRPSSAVTGQSFFPDQTGRVEALPDTSGIFSPLNLQPSTLDLQPGQKPG